MTWSDDTPERVSICGIVGRLTCSQENEVYLRLLKIPEYLEAFAIDRICDARSPGTHSAPEIAALAHRRAHLSTIIAPIIARLMAEVTK